MFDAFLPPRERIGTVAPSAGRRWLTEMAYSTDAMSPSPASTIDEIRRKVVKELVDVEVAFARRRLTRRQRIARGLRRRSARIRRFGR